MRRTLSFLLGTIILFMLCACNNNNQGVASLNTDVIDIVEIDTTDEKGVNKVSYAEGDSVLTAKGTAYSIRNNSGQTEVVISVWLELGEDELNSKDMFQILAPTGTTITDIFSSFADREMGSSKINYFYGISYYSSDIRDKSAFATYFKKKFGKNYDAKKGAIKITISVPKEYTNDSVPLLLSWGYGTATDTAADVFGVYSKGITVGISKG